MTYYQRTQQVKKGLREGRKAYRSLDTQLEKLERELDRLIKRKTLVGPESLDTLVKLWDAVTRTNVPATGKALANAVNIASI